MKREKLTAKQRIQKQIEFRNSKLVFIDGKGKSKMNERELARIRPDKGPTASTIDVKLLTNNERTALRTGEKNSIGVSSYQKKAFVDYDVVICIPSHERFGKVKRLLSQFYDQPSKYTIKIILLNDGSTDERYDSLPELFSNLTYLKNNTPNGKALHWYCYSQMWETVKEIQCHAVLQMDDDFILCNSFLDTIVDLFFQQKETNDSVMGIAPHLWSFKRHKEHESWWKYKDFVDGIALLDDAVIKFMEYKMNPVDADEVNKPGVPVRAWSQICVAIKAMKGIIYRTGNSLVYHDGNEDSKLHAGIRDGVNKGVFTQRYIGNL